MWISVLVRPGADLGTTADSDGIALLQRQQALGLLPEGDDGHPHPCTVLVVGLHLADSKGVAGGARAGL